MVYECLVCMESLESAAPKVTVPSIDNVAPRSHKKLQPPTTNPADEDLLEICATRCGHMFHRVCFDRWLKKSTNRDCPSCRKKVALKKVLRMFPPISLDDSVNNGSLARNILDERGIPICQCSNQLCINLHEIHQTLVMDVNDLHEKFEEKVDEVNLLKSENKDLENRITKMKELLEAKNTKKARRPDFSKRTATATSAPTSTATKRQRTNKMNQPT